ncbi:hypothetical protein [Natronococcus occultus]|uniref:Uncharacterized protein n=1 Tax=Natronococcus occultus SP4 TaxID=694430 RepID=L0JZR3_9EURY|nr:hypothetical protein [Natronococcus occultus]AGB38542.1 hypothetical protein Natoc_2783 [Natronococcus occultus SP4]
MSAPQAPVWADVSKLSSFLDRLEETGGLSARGLVEELEVDVPAEGVAYHDRGIRIPGYDATFVHEPTGSRGRPAFSVQIDTIGPRNGWAIFDRTLSWDVYLLRTEGAAAIAWLSDEEYRIEEADEFDSKHEAMAAGRFSFGVFLYAGEDWEEQQRRIRSTNAPAYLLREDGQPMIPNTQSEFYNLVDSTVTEFRTSGAAADYLGLLELEATIDG